VETSARTGRGKGELLALIAQLRDAFREEHPDNARFGPGRRRAAAAAAADAAADGSGNGGRGNTDRKEDERLAAEQERYRQAAEMTERWEGADDPWGQEQQAQQRPQT